MVRRTRLVAVFERAGRVPQVYVNRPRFAECPGDLDRADRVADGEHLLMILAVVAARTRLLIGLRFGRNEVRGCQDEHRDHRRQRNAREKSLGHDELLCCPARIGGRTFARTADSMPRCGRRIS